jgi:anti-sigma regulatory factor (Ser/Thr protein kinase)
MPGRTSMPPPDGGRIAEIRACFDDLPAGHVASFYDSRDSQLRVAAAFVASVLRDGRRCLYLTHDNAPDEMRSWLRAAGIDTEARTDAGDLRIRRAADAYLDGGRFDTDRIVDALADAAAGSVDDGYAGLGVAGENSWCFRTEADFDGIAEFEAAFDARSPDLPVTTLCQYGLDEFDEAAIAKAIRTHAYVVYRETVCPNPYYVPPEEYVRAGDSGVSAALMLEQIHDLARTRRTVERHQQRLSVVNRILRHDIRNDLNVVLGSVDALRETVADDPDARDRLDAIERVATRLVDRAEKARYVQQTLGDSAVEPVDLDSVVGRAVAEIRERWRVATISVAADASPTVLADRQLHTALVELLTNAIVHQQVDQPSATLTTARHDDRVTIEVSNPGPPIPDADRRALLEGVETPLEHAGGLGLWLVKWIVDNSRGSLRIPDGDDDRSRIVVELQVVE